MDKLKALDFFVRVAETNSFSQTAAMLDVPASSVSRRIQDLENLLGVALFHRSTRVVKLTELGTLYLEQVKPAIAALNFADEVVGQYAATPSGILKITVSPDYGQFRLLPVLTKLRERYPEIICDVELTDEITNIAQNDVDIAIRATASLPDRAVARKLADGHFAMVASPAYLNRHGMPVKVADLYHHKVMLYRRPQGILYWQAKMADGWHELRLPPAFISNHGSALLDEAIAGRGLALIPRWAILTNLAEGSLIQVNLDDADMAASRNENAGIYLLYHRPKYGLKKIKTAVDFIISELSEMV